MVTFSDPIIVLFSITIFVGLMVIVQSDFVLP